jgi:Domain of unknown function (DUF4382)
MRSKWFLGLLATGSVALLTSCSGLGDSGPCTDCGGGNAKLTISIYDTPPTGTSVLSFTLPIAGISLTPSTGSPVAVPTAVSSVEMTRLQSDSTVIVDAASVAAGTYTGINVTVGPTSATNNVFVNASGSAITSSAGTCLNGAVCNLPVGAIFTLSVPLSLTLSGDQNQWIGLDFNLNNAITSANGISVDFTQPAVLTATTTVRTGIPAGSVETMEDFIGVVTAYTAGGSITVQSGMTGVSLTASLNSNTQYDLAPVAYSQCSGGLAAPCLTIGTTVSIDTLVASNGTFTASEVDILDAAKVDEVEGTIYPTTTPGVVGMILADKVSASGNATLGASTTTVGTGIFLDISSLSPIYSIDTKTLSIPLPAPSGFNGSGDLFAGQVIRAQVINVASGSSGIVATASNILLRWSRLSGTINSVSGTTGFTITNLPTYVNSLNTTLSITPFVGVYQGYTVYDGVSSTTDQNFTVGSTVSIRTLYLNNSVNQTPFSAAKVRVP